MKKKKTKQKIHTCFSVFVKLWVSKRKRKRKNKEEEKNWYPKKKKKLLKADLVFFFLSADVAILTTQI